MRIIIGLLLLAISISVGATTKKSVPPKVTPSYMLLNLDTGLIVDSYNEHEVRSIASITKLMTVLIVLRSNLRLDELLTVVGSESSKHISRGMRVTREHLIELALISSDNLATRTLAENFPGGYSQFIDQMNDTATQLQMSNTRYRDSTGLLADNRSSANDLLKLLNELENLPLYRMAANARNIIFDAIGIKKPVRVTGNNTNLYAGKLDILVAKTGFTNSAGRCLTMLFVHNNTRYFLVVMGASSAEHRRKIVDSLLDKIR